MIKYNLTCKTGHAFESWFNSSADYDKLSAKGLVECAVCGNKDVRKSLMAPGVATGKSKDQVKAEQAYAEAVKAVKSEMKDAKNVGWSFAGEARAMHSGEKEHKPIYGRTEPAEAVELIKEGINIMPLPFDPDAKDN